LRRTRNALGGRIVIAVPDGTQIARYFIRAGEMNLGRQNSRMRRRRAAGHRCPECRQGWALTAKPVDGGFVVECNYCAYERPVRIPKQKMPPGA
jgi:hypothetical protein